MTKTKKKKPTRAEMQRKLHEHLICASAQAGAAAEGGKLSAKFAKNAERNINLALRLVDVLFYK